MASRVTMICDSYESGFGHGMADDGLDLSKTPHSDPELGEAYQIGYEAGQAARMQPTPGWLPPSAGPGSAPSIEAAHAIGASGGPYDEDERLAFEAWMNGHCWELGAFWDGTGYRGAAEHSDYVCPLALQARQLWAAWRDRAALARSG